MNREGGRTVGSGHVVYNEFYPKGLGFRGFFMYINLQRNSE